MKIGIVAGSFKPLHVGHFNLITRASQECDSVHILASVSDRGRVTGRKMRQVWMEHIISVLPKNAKVEFCSNPIRRTWEYMGWANKSDSDDVFYLYSAPEDVNKNFPSEVLRKYVNRLYEGSQVVMVPVTRSGEFDVSGTQVRKYIEQHDRDAFIRCLPSCIDRDAVWDILVGG